MFCQEIMTEDVECLSPNDTAQYAARRMRELNIGFLPVCDASGKAIGTLTDRDIAVRLVAENGDASTPVSTLMTREVISCRPKDDVQIAQSLMAQHHKSRIMVVHDGGRVTGVISLSDIAQFEADAGAKTLRAITKREARVHA